MIKAEEYKRFFELNLSEEILKNTKEGKLNLSTALLEKLLGIASFIEAREKAVYEGHEKKHFLFFPDSVLKVLILDDRVEYQASTLEEYAMGFRRV